MSTNTPEARAKAAAKRARAKKRAQLKRDAKMMALGALLGMVTLAFVALTHSNTQPTQATPQPTTATVVSKAYHSPKHKHYQSYDLQHENTGDYVQSEDGTYVPRGYYSQVAGPTKKVCDYLHKTLVSDPVYGTRCL